MGEEKLTAELIVGSTYFNKGVAISTAQGAIDRLWDELETVRAVAEELRTQLSAARAEAIRLASGR